VAPPLGQRLPVRVQQRPAGDPLHLRGARSDIGGITGYRPSVTWSPGLPARHQPAWPKAARAPAPWHR